MSENNNNSTETDGKFRKMSSEDTTPVKELGINTADNNLKDGQCLIDNSKNDDLNSPLKERTGVELKNSEFRMNDADDIKADDSGEANVRYNALASNEVVVSENDDISQNIECSTNNVEKNDIEDKQNRGEDHLEDLKCKDSVCLDENIPLKNNMDKAYMDEIRRLSIDIVKDVIESARSSVYEIFNKNDETSEGKTGDVPDNLEDNNQISKYAQFQFGNGNKYVEDNSAEGINKIQLNESKLSVKDPLEGNNYLCESIKEKNQNELIDGKDGTADEDILCGIWCFKPQYIQQYRRPKVFLILFSIMGVIHGCYYSYFVSIISTLEKRYAFKTKVSGTLLLADEITPLILGVIVGYIGSRTHRPRMVALGMFMSVACCFISGFPYLIYGPAKHLSSIKYQNETGPDICDVEFKSGQCDTDDARPTMTVVGIFLVASFLKGFATLSYYVIGIPYMDDNIKKKNSPLYLAIALALRLLGPLIGFLMSSVFLKLYENPADDPGYGPEDPRWIGAWWIGFFLQGILLLIFTLPIALFPRRLPGQRRVEKNISPGNEDGLKQVFLGLYSALKRLGTNPVFILMIVNTNMKIFGHFGHSIMLPKYMENQFRLSASAASLYSGATSVTFVMLSTIIGGYLIWKFQPRIKVLLAGMIIAEITLCVGLLILMIPRCQSVSMVNFGMNDEGLVLDSSCNEMCDCSTTSYTPFCGPNGTIYFSPCYAGCTEKLISSPSEKSKEFGNCTCVEALKDEQIVPTISEGVCPDENCWSQALIYLIIYFIVLTFVDLFTVAHSMILLRSVHPNDKSIALGTFETFICLFGFIPYPVTFGALVDSACLVWEKSCGETGNCWFYDMEKYSYLLHCVGALFCAFSSLCLIGLYFLSSRIRDLYIDEDEEKDNIDTIKLDTISGSVTKL